MDQHHHGHTSRQCGHHSGMDLRCCRTQRDATWLPFPFSDSFQFVVAVVFVNLQRASRQGGSKQLARVGTNNRRLFFAFLAETSGQQHLERHDLPLQCHKYFPIMTHR